MMKTYFSSDEKDFVLHQGDSMSALSNIGQQVDMIFADPPYFLLKILPKYSELLKMSDL